MSRPLRIQFPAAVYHVMNRGAARQPTFADDKDYQAFIDTVGGSHRLWGFEVFGYCLMGNDYHRCLRTPIGDLSRVPVYIRLSKLRYWIASAMWPERISSDPSRSAMVRLTLRTLL